MQFLLSYFYRNQFFSTTFVTKGKFGNFTEQSSQRALVKKKFCEILVGLLNTDIDAHDFYRWTKKEEEIVQSSFCFCQLIFMKDCSPSYQKHVMELNL